ncbi:hypothetical protein B0H13DRAFT_2390635 [Mycena leptocephala]|nr:hypothetical protein B0H13DRAFT_2390635 [Mycena leptocephala]
MHAILPAGLPVQELWDLIIDEIHSKQDLQSCSLVCRAFVARAQFPLFRLIYIWRTTHQQTVTTAIYLASLLAASPYLIPHIRNLTLGVCDADALSYGNRDWTASVMRHGCSADVIGGGI